MNDNKHKVQVFQAEIDAGLEQVIQSSASIAYEAPAMLGASSLISTLPDKCDKDIECSLNVEQSSKEMPFLKASKEDSDIYHVYSILVSTSWNKNDDVFDKDEVWAAKDTPKYKPTNLEHDEKQIVGGIIDNWAVDENLNLIDTNIDHNNLPDHYHILVSSVIYKQWQDPEYRDRVLDLINKIEAGDKYVSMECVFHGFDYAVIAPDGKHHILSRNEETAFLTQHLRSYGGTGSYQDHNIGRLLRNITFSGKGFVDKPANPESVIFDKNKVFEFNKASISDKSSLFNPNGVILEVDNPNILNIQESYDMSNEILNDQITELKNSLEAVKAENKTLIDKLSEANVEKYEQNIAKLTEQCGADAEHIKTLQTDLEASQTKVDDLTVALEEVTTDRDGLHSKIAEMESVEKARSRKATLIEAGLSDSEAEAKLDTFAGLNDEQFAVLAETLASYTKNNDVPSESDVAVESQDSTASDDTKEHSEAQEVAEEKVDEEVLETVQAEEASPLSAESDESLDSDDRVESVRAGLQDWVQTVILSNTNSKSGE